MTETETTPNHQRPSRWPRVLILAIIVLGGLLRYQMLEAFYLDFDESMHFQAAKEPDLASAYEGSKLYTHPPLIFLFYHYWIKLGTSEAFLRIPSLVFGVLSLGLGYLWLHEWAGRRAGIVGLVLLAFSPPMIRISSVMRSYTLLMCFFFGALYFAARLLKKPSAGSALGMTACLAAANFTHYSAAWFTLVLGIAVLVPVLARQIPLKVAAIWASGQVLILAICGFFYVSHVAKFVQSATRDNLWEDWLRDVHGTPGLGLTVKMIAIKTLQFLGFVFGNFYFLIPLAMVGACWLLVRKAREEKLPRSLLASRLVLILLPLVVANVLLCRLIYPLGPTRHSVWLVPFVVAAAAMCLAHSFLPGRRIPAVLATLLLGFWAITHAVLPIARFETPMTIANVEETVAVFKDRIPQTDVVIVDDATRNVLDYYLGRAERNPPKNLAHGYTEYAIGGYRDGFAAEVFHQSKQRPCELVRVLGLHGNRLAFAVLAGLSGL